LWVGEVSCGWGRSVVGGGGETRVFEFRPYCVVTSAEGQSPKHEPSCDGCKLLPRTTHNAILASWHKM